MSRGGHTLVVRLDSVGDVLLSGPAVRAVAAGSDRVTFLAGPQGREAAALLPGVDEVLTWTCPWVVRDPERVHPSQVWDVVAGIRDCAPDRALVLTSFHQSSLATALVLRLAQVPYVAAVSEDYPGSLLDLRLPDPGDVHEAERALSVARGAGFDLPPGDDGRLRVRPTASPAIDLDAGTVVLHPGTTASARAWPLRRWQETCRALVGQGHPVAVTGTAGEAALTAAVVGATSALDLAGRTTLPELAGVLGEARAVVVANTGAAHLAAAVGTPVVSLFAPTVPAVRWRPYRVPTALLGDQEARCRGSRATRCPVPGHPCLTGVTAHAVLEALETLEVLPSPRADRRVPVGLLTAGGPA